MTAILTRRLAERWTAAGLGGELPAIVNDYIDSATRIGTEGQAHAEKVRAARQSRVDVLVAGTGKATTAPDWQDFGAASKRVHVEAVGALKNVGDRLITEQLAPAHADLLDQARPLVPLIGVLVTNEQALASTTTTQAREAWVELARLWDARTELTELFRLLLSEGTVPTLVREQDAWPWRQFARPSAGPKLHSHWWTHPHTPAPAPVQLAALVTDEHRRGPGLYTRDQVAEHRASWETELVAAVRPSALVGGRAR